MMSPRMNPITMAPLPPVYAYRLGAKLPREGDGQTSGQAADEALRREMTAAFGALTTTSAPTDGAVRE